MTGTHEPGDPSRPNTSGEPTANNPDQSGHHHQTGPTEATRLEVKVRKVEIVISRVLRSGVILSVLVIVVGLVLTFAHHSAYLPITGQFSYNELISKGVPFPHSFVDLAHSIARGEGRGVVVLGVLVLILTPVLRVAVGVLSFLYQKDLAMTLVTLYVLAVLLGSFFLATV